MIRPQDLLRRTKPGITKYELTFLPHILGKRRTGSPTRDVSWYALPE
jgi:hypothetical protein